MVDKEAALHTERELFNAVNTVKRLFDMNAGLRQRFFMGHEGGYINKILAHVRHAFMIIHLFAKDNHLASAI